MSCKKSNMFSGEKFEQNVKTDSTGINMILTDKGILFWSNDPPNLCSPPAQYISIGNFEEKIFCRKGSDNKDNFKDRQPIPFHACAVVIYLLELDNIWLVLLFNIISVRYVTIYISYFN